MQSVSTETECVTEVTRTLSELGVTNQSSVLCDEDKKEESSEGVDLDDIDILKVDIGIEAGEQIEAAGIERVVNNLDEKDESEGSQQKPVRQESGAIPKIRAPKHQEESEVLISNVTGEKGTAQNSVDQPYQCVASLTVGSETEIDQNTTVPKTIYGDTEIPGPYTDITQNKAETEVDGHKEFQQQFSTVSVDGGEQDDDMFKQNSELKKLQQQQQQDDLMYIRQQKHQKFLQDKKQNDLRQQQQSDPLQQQQVQQLSDARQHQQKQSDPRQQQHSDPRQQQQHQQSDHTRQQETGDPRQQQSEARQHQLQDLMLQQQQQSVARQPQWDQQQHLQMDNPKDDPLHSSHVQSQDTLQTNAQVPESRGDPQIAQGGDGSVNVFGGRLDVDCLSVNHPPESEEDEERQRAAGNFYVFGGNVNIGEVKGIEPPPNFDVFEGDGVIFYSEADSGIAKDFKIHLEQDFLDLGIKVELFPYIDINKSIYASLETVLYRFRYAFVIITENLKQDRSARGVHEDLQADCFEEDWKTERIVLIWTSDDKRKFPLEFKRLKGIKYYERNSEDDAVKKIYRDCIRKQVKIVRENSKKWEKNVKEHKDKHKTED